MSEMQFNKLVRDRIPEIIQNNGEHPHTRILVGDERIEEALKKLAEEATELLQDRSIGERADVQQILNKIDALLGFTPEEIEAARAAKEAEKGGFDQDIFLIATAKDD